MKTSRCFILVSLVTSSLIAADAPRLQSKLVAPDGGTYFGVEVGLSGDRALIGSESAGYVFVRRQQWEFEQKLAPDLSFAPTARLRRFVIDNDRALLTITESNPFGTGKAIVYERINDIWAVKAELAIPAGIGMSFEHDAAMSQDTIVLTAHESLQLVALIYERRGSDWVLTQKLAPSQLARQHKLFCAIDGERLALGVDGTDAAQLASSAVYLYARVSGSWVLGQTLALDNLSYTMGFDMAFAGPRLLIGAPAFRTLPSEDGLAFVERFDGTQWVQEQRLQVPNLRWRSTSSQPTTPARPPVESSG